LTGFTPDSEAGSSSSQMIVAGSAPCPPKSRWRTNLLGTAEDGVAGIAVTVRSEIEATRLGAAKAPLRDRLNKEYILSCGLFSQKRFGSFFIAAFGGTPPFVATRSVYTIIFSEMLIKYQECDSSSE
jgi:hypothetical protein